MEVKHFKKPGLGKPLLVSLVLHAGVFTFVYFASSAQPIEEELPLDPLRNFEITLVTRNPQELPLPLPVQDEPLDPAQAIEAASIEELNVSEFVDEDSKIEALPKEALLMRADELTFIEPRPALDRNIGVQDNDDSSNLDLSPAGITKAISSYMADYNEDLNQLWLSDCLKYKNQHGTQDCPQGDEDSYHPNQHLRRIMSRLNQGANDLVAARKLEDAMQLLGSLNSTRGDSAENNLVNAVIKQSHDYYREKSLALRGISREPEMLVAADWVLKKPMFGAGVGEPKIDLPGIYNNHLEEQEHDFEISQGPAVTSENDEELKPFVLATPLFPAGR